ncbi:hypothetical protein GCM10027610_129300 [Dactylosporangium cerinum]
MEVHRGAALHLGDLAVRDPDRGDNAGAAGGGDDLGEGDAAYAAEVFEVAFDGLFGAVPQFAGEGVEDRVPGVVVAVQAQRLSELGVVGGVAAPADCGLSGTTAHH